MANFAWMLEVFGDLTRNRADVALRGRYCREAGIIDRSTKGRSDPQTEDVHIISMLLAILAGSAQVNAPDRVKKLWRLQQAVAQARYTDVDGSQMRGAGIVQSSPFGFGQTLLHLLNLATRDDERDQDIFKSQLTNVVVLRDSQAAVINWNDRSEYYYTPGGVISIGVTDIDTMTVIPGVAFLYLATLLNHSRKMAELYDVKTSTENVWKALGFVPPAPFPPHCPLIELSEHQADSTQATEKAKAAGAPPPTASTKATDHLGRSKRSPSDYQSENEQTVEVSNEQSISRRRSAQRRGDASVDRSPHKRMRTNDRRPDEQHLDDGADPIAA